MNPPELSIIIVNWNSADYVLACVRSIREQTAALSYEVIVVDNASYDGCGERLAQEYPEVVFIQNQSNIGFASANNLGADHARGSVLLFLNPDTEIRDRAIDVLYDHMRMHPDAGVVSCRLLNSDGSLQTSCVQSFPTVLNQVLDADVLRRCFPKAELWGTAVFLESGDVMAEVEAISGACMMMRRQAFDLVGGFSSEYFMYAEDLDLCYKTRRARLRNYYVGAAAIVHHGGGSSKRTGRNFSDVMMRESVGLLLRKFRGESYSRCYRLALSGAAAIRLGLLAVLFPVYFARRRVPAWSSSCRKWYAIICWGTGVLRIPRQYGAMESAAAGRGREKRVCAGSAEN